MCVCVTVANKDYRAQSLPHCSGLQFLRIVDAVMSKLPEESFALRREKEGKKREVQRTGWLYNTFTHNVVILSLVRAPLRSHRLHFSPRYLLQLLDLSEK